MSHEDWKYYYDVCYKSPMGRYGTHYSVEATSEEHAKKVSPWWLSRNTPWAPEEFTVIDVKLSTEGYPTTITAEKQRLLTEQDSTEE